MDLRLSPEEEAFRGRVRSLLARAERPPGLRDYGSTPTGDDIEAAKRWQQTLDDAGFSGLSWPVEYGGRGATTIEQAIFAEEAALAGVPRQLNLVGLELVGPVIARYGTDEQRARHLRPILRGEEVWCQLFSEPDAGSDLAGLRARAERVGDRFVVSGQKVWTSGAHYADLGLLLARTDPQARPHAGISCFVVPMDLAGISVSPIRQIDGEAKFNEVHLDGVEVAASALVGELNDGWRVAMSTLGRERLSLGAHAVGLLEVLRQVGQGWEGLSAIDRHRWLGCWTRVRLLRWTWLRALSGGEGVADPGMSVLKLVASELQRDVGELAASAAGMAAVAGPAGEDDGRRLLTSLGATIAGGTSEIQRNILAERVLGLPRVDRS